VIAAYDEHVVMRETLAEALSALFAGPGAAPTVPQIAPEAPGAGSVKDALDHYDQAMTHLKSGDWAGFGTEIEAMRAILQDLSRQPTRPAPEGKATGANPGGATHMDGR
jgi:uncharacterized membrane protein (UPF0182 family)